jgi:hypothetical protein
MHRSPRAALLPFLALAISAACSKEAAAPPPAVSPYAPPPTMAAAVKVVDIDVGRAVDMDKRISDKTDSFKPTDTIYVSVGTEGSSSGTTLAAHWTYQDGQVVKHDEASVAPSGAAHTEFHISKPSGWPAGDYKVEVMLNGASAGTKSFKVSK